MPLFWSQLSSAQAQALPRSQTVFFFPVGPIEDHGPHLPMGLDLIEAEALCYRMAEAAEKELSGWVGVILPAAPLGIESNTLSFAMTVRPHVLRDWLVDACISLAKAGFHHFACVTGHTGPRQLTAIEDAGGLLVRRFLWRKLIGRPLPRLLSLQSFEISAKTVFSSPFKLNPSEHGGKRDTSVALELSPKLVDPILPGLQAWTHRSQSYWGNPSLGTAKEGSQALDSWIRGRLPELKEIWLGQISPRSTFRSWYSILAPNKSFFKAYSLALILFLVMVGWLFLSASFMSFPINP